MSKHRQLKWVWHPETGETFLDNMVVGSAIIYKMSDIHRNLEVSLGFGDVEYLIVEALKQTPHDHAAQKQALARLRFHTNAWLKRERKRYASVQRDANELIRRLGK